MKNSFHGPIQRPLVQILKNPGANGKHFLKLHPSAKFQVFRFIHSKVLTIFKKKYFLGPIWHLVKILENPAAKFQVS